MKRTFMGGWLLSVATMLMIVVFVSHSVLGKDVKTISWTKLPESAIDISINAEGQAYVVSKDGAPLRWDKEEQRWRRMSGKFVRISAAEGNRPWAINSDGVVYRYNGLWWENKDTGVADVAADTAGNVYIAKKDGSIKRWYSLRSEWRPIESKAKAKRISLDNSGHPWIVTATGALRSFDGKEWKTLPGHARDISLGINNQVIIADKEGFVREWNVIENRWDKVEGIADVISVAVTPDGGFWAVMHDGSIMATSLLASEVTEVKEDRAKEIIAPVAVAPVAVAPVNVASNVNAAPVVVPPVVAPSNNKKPPSRTVMGTSDPAGTPFKGKLTFVNTRKNATSLAIGKDGSVFALKGSTVLRWSNARQTFDTFPGNLVQIAVDPEGNPWGISALGRIFRHTGKLWKQIQGATGSDIAIGADGTVVITDASGALYRLNDVMTRFDRITGNGVLVAVGVDGTPWTVRADKLVQRCDTSPCTVLPQKAFSLATGPDGSVWIVSDRSLLMRLKADGASFEVVQTAGYTPAKVSVGPNGYPWVTTTTQVALSSNYFERDEESDRTVAAATSNDTVGTGATQSVVSTQVSGFTFVKNMQFETINTDFLSGGEYALLSAGNDGVFYAYNFGVGFLTFNSKLKKLETKTTTAGTCCTYQPLDFDVETNGDIWFYTDPQSPKEAVYRERNKVVKEYAVGSGNDSYNGIAVTSNNSVYVCRTQAGGTSNIYVKKSNSEVFKKSFSYSHINKFDVGPGDDIWIVDQKTYVRQWTGTTFAKRPESGQKAKNVSIGADGTVYIIGSDNFLYKWNSANKSFDKINNSTTSGLAVDDDGRPWLSVNNTPTVKRAK
jgi:roadblock/LC7 domain-containing protein